MKVLRVVPKFRPPETYSESVARIVNPVLDSYTHIAIVDDDTSVPEAFFQLPEEYADADLIFPRVLPSSRIYRTCETLTYELGLCIVNVKCWPVRYSQYLTKAT